MAYTINLTDGSIFATISDGTINTSSSMILVGKNYAGYGKFLDENFIHLIENGANTTPPNAPLTGQLWWDKTNNVMKVYNGTIFKVISASTAAASAPTSNVAGDLWFDTVNQQLKVYNGSAWILVGPASTSGQGTSGAIVTTLTDTLSVNHVVIQLYVSDTLVGLISKSPTFTPVPSISGFSSISPGFQLSTTVSNVLFRGTSTDAQLLGGLTSSQFLRSDTNDTTSGTLGVLSDSGFTVGLDQDVKISVNTGTSEVTLQNQTQDANLTIKVNDGGVTTTVFSVNGSTSLISLPTGVTLNATGEATAIVNGAGNGIGNIGSSSSYFNQVYSTAVTLNAAGTAIINGAGNGIGNIGSSSSYFNHVYATATTALYADVAERFHADEIMDSGTVVELGGANEITKSRQALSDNVFGVISTSPAFTMNGGAGNDGTHPPIAMTGRVPVKVIGAVKKGDRLVSAGGGTARSAQPGEATYFNVIGRALESKQNQELGMVEAIVTIK